MWSLVRFYLTGGHRALYLFDDVQPLALTRNPHRSESGTKTLLYLHGVFNDTVATLVAGKLASDSRALGQWTVTGCAGRFDQ